MVFKYESGIEIRKGDRVLFHGEPGEIKFVAAGPDDPETDWYVEQYGGGVMVVEPRFFGSAFLPAELLEHSEYLEFVSRAEEK